MSVSVVMPCYDERPDRVRDSVLSAIYAGADEVVLVDDGSHFEVQVPLAHHVSVYRQEHAGISAALNHAIAKSTGEWICWLSCGDYMDRDALTAYSSSDAPAVFGVRRGEGGHTHPPNVNWRELMWHDSQFCMGATRIHRSVIDAVGGFDESIQYCVDWEMALRIEDCCGWVYVPAVTLTAERHPDGHSDGAAGDSQRARWEQKCRDRAQVSRWARPLEKPCVRRWRARA